MRWICTPTVLAQFDGEFPRAFASTVELLGAWQLPSAHEPQSKRERSRRCLRDLPHDWREPAVRSDDGPCAVRWRTHQEKPVVVGPSGPLTVGTRKFYESVWQWVIDLVNDLSTNVVRRRLALDAFAYWLEDESGIDPRSALRTGPHVVLPGSLEAANREVNAVRLL